MQVSRGRQGHRDLLIEAALLVGIPIVVILAVSAATMVGLYVSEEAGSALVLLVAGVVALGIVCAGLYALWRFFRGDMTRDDGEPVEFVAYSSWREIPWLKTLFSWNDELTLIVLGGTGTVLWVGYVLVAEAWVPGLGVALSWLTALELVLAVAVGLAVLLVITVALAVRGVLHLLRRLRGDT